MLEPFPGCVGLLGGVLARRGDVRGRGGLVGAPIDHFLPYKRVGEWIGVHRAHLHGLRADHRLGRRQERAHEGGGGCSPNPRNPGRHFGETAFFTGFLPKNSAEIFLFLFWRAAKYPPVIVFVCVLFY